MPCNRRGCPHPGDHVHLRLRDERAIANVLLAEAAGRYRGVMITTNGKSARARERDHDDRTRTGPEG